jgi:hypothetical protein
MSGATLTSLVLDCIARNPGATVDQIMPHLPGYTRKQVMSTMRFQRSSGRLTCEPQHPTGVTGSKPGRYFIVGKRVIKDAPAPIRPRNSVFDMLGVE